MHRALVFPEESELPPEERAWRKRMSVPPRNLELSENWAGVRLYHSWEKPEAEWNRHGDTCCHMWHVWCGNTWNSYTDMMAALEVWDRLVKGREQR